MRDDELIIRVITQKIVESQRESLLAVKTTKNKWNKDVYYLR